MQRGRLPQRPVCADQSRVQIFVVCEETGKKFRLIFKEAVFGIVTVFHIRQQLKRLLPGQNFELYFRGQLLADSVFCKSSHIVSGSTILLRQTDTQSGALQYKNFLPDQARSYEKHFAVPGDSPVSEQAASKDMINSAQFSDYPEIDLTFGRTQMSAAQQLANKSAVRGASEKK